MTNIIHPPYDDCKIVGIHTTAECGSTRVVTADPPAPRFDVLRSWAETLRQWAAADGDQSTIPIARGHLRDLAREIDIVTVSSPPAITPPAQPAGWQDGTLFCYGGCGTRYQDFARDMLLPTALWNRIAVGEPFDATQEHVEREGRGGVLCPACIVARLAALPECTAVFADIVDQRHRLQRLSTAHETLEAENARLRRLLAPFTQPRVEPTSTGGSLDQLRLQAEHDQLRAEKDGAYHERNQLVALLSKLWPSHLAQHPEDPNWDLEWTTIVCIHAPFGQLSWHIHDSEWPLFAHLSEAPNDWDGHTTPEKYERIAAVTIESLRSSRETEQRQVIAFALEWVLPLGSDHEALKALRAKQVDSALVAYQQRQPQEDGQS